MFSKDCADFLKSKKFTIELTLDQSPTLRGLEGESMHHSGGAASESLYIYLKALNLFYHRGAQSFEKPLEKIKIQWEGRKIQDQVLATDQIFILSVGFGLGYNEIIVTLWAILNQIHLSSLNIVSFEKEQFLYEEFELWLNNKETMMSEVYDKVLNDILKFNNTLDPEQLARHIKEQLVKMIADNKWSRQLELSSTADLQNKFHVFLFDAFSRKTTPHLWAEEFLESLLVNHSQSNSVFGTYACTGDLKRALEKNHFTFIKRDGFQGKRNSSLAFKKEYL